MGGTQIGQAYSFVLKHFLSVVQLSMSKELPPKMVLLARWTRGPERPIITNPAADGVSTGL